MKEAAKPFLHTLELDADISRNDDGTLPTHWVH